MTAATTAFPLAAFHRGPLRGDEVRVWSASLDLPEGALEHVVRHLADDEQHRLARFRFTRDAVRFAASRVALRAGLAECLGIDPGAIVFRYGLYGKPELGPPFDRSGLRFNGSRSEGIGLYAVATGRPVGVDIERVRPLPDLDEIAARTFSPEERRRLRRLDPAERLAGFFNCWTRKEAYLKALGVGLAGAPTGFTVSLAPGAPARLDHVADDPHAPQCWTLDTLDIDLEHVAALAVKARTA